MRSALLHAICCWILLALWGIAPIPSVRAQSEAPPDTAATEPADSSRRGRLALLPIFFRSPDTGAAFGILPQYIFHLGADSRPSNIRLDAYYTQKQQMHILLRPSLWLPGNRYQIDGRFSFRHWPNSFYGIGIDAPSDAETFTERLFETRLQVQHQLRPGLFAGLQYSFRYGKLIETEAGGQLAQETITGSTRGVASGLSLVASWDTRDHVFYPSAGGYYRVALGGFGAVLGSDYNFQTLSIDLRQYTTVFRSHVLAVQMDASFTGGDPPFRMLPGLGETLRGYSSMRYIDRNRVAVQVAYRMVPVWWRLGVVVFGGLGTVAGRLDGFSLNEIKAAVGAGLRFQIYRSDRINIRFDYGIGMGSSGDYIDLTEAF